MSDSRLSRISAYTSTISFFSGAQSNRNSARTAPVRLPTVSQLNCAVTSVIDWLKSSDIGPEIMPIGASMPDITKYARKLARVIRCVLFNDPARLQVLKAPAFSGCVMRSPSTD